MQARTRDLLPRTVRQLVEHMQRFAVLELGQKTDGGTAAFIENRRMVLVKLELKNLRDGQLLVVSEASQLVLQSGPMAKNGELFVLDMGQPIRILDLAESMIRLSGVQGVEIIETGLRPGEKLYEELLVKTEQLGKTENSLIFIEKDTPLRKEELDERLALLEQACDTQSDEAVREALRQTVPTYCSPDDVNVPDPQPAELRTRRPLRERCKPVRV